MITVKHIGYFIFFFICFFTYDAVKADLSEIDALSVIKPQTTVEIQQKAVENIIERLIPERAKEFQIIINPLLAALGKDAFKLLKTREGIIQVTGSTGVAASYGFHHYLKYYCNAHVSWEVKQLNIPEVLPDVNISITAMDRVRYYMNPCAYGYSHLWWNWSDWEQHIDWIALNGFNVALAPLAQEAIWLRVYTKMNLTEEGVNRHFTGPAWLPWNRLGNLHSWGGPLSKHWHSRTLYIQKKIMKRMFEIGVTPVLSAFNGYVPEEFIRVYPNAEANKVKTFEVFDDKFRYQYFLEPRDPMFIKVGSAYIKEQINEFGTGHIYTCDPFNEIKPQAKNKKEIMQISQTIYKAMSGADPEAIWVLQSSGFFYHGIYWTKEFVKAFLHGPPLGRMIIQDTQSEHFTLSTKFESFFGQPYIWCLYHNFGGSPSMYAPLKSVNENIFKSRENSNMVGTGVIPEGINHNYVLYDQMIEMGWRDKPTDLDQWIKNYTTRRYGQFNTHAFKAWIKLKETVYSYDTKKKGKLINTIYSSPGLNLLLKIWHNGTLFMEAWDEFLLASDELKQSEGFRYDLVDVTKHALQTLFDIYYLDMKSAFIIKNDTGYFEAVDIMERILEDFDRILLTNEHFMLGPYLEKAKAAANSTADRRLFEYNARNIITLWGPRGEREDYSFRPWAGLASDFYLARWKIFFDELKIALIYDTWKYSSSRKLKAKIFEKIEKPFTRKINLYPVKPEGDTVEISKELHSNWRNAIKSPILEDNENILSMIFHIINSNVLKIYYIVTGYLSQINILGFNPINE